MTYMLDTNIIIYARNARPEIVLTKFRQFAPEDLCISSITLAELEYGVFCSSRPEQNQLAILSFLSSIQTLPFGQKAAMEYGRIRADLKTRGCPIGANDFLIAAHAVSEDLILATNNAKEFERIPDLKLENWVV